ncbi:MAG: preprotein translocase subunit SecE [Spirulina sp. SIO3F2]|nr:preprotein translocase subunit SecE [Spirulina sp. SIO3F2]
MAKKKKKSTTDNSGNGSSKAARQKSTPATSDVTATPTSEPESKGGFDVFGFLKESREELAKVVWPSRQQLIGESVTVILMVTLVATTIYLVDNLFSWLSDTVFL